MNIYFFTWFFYIYLLRIEKRLAKFVGWNRESQNFKGLVFCACLSIWGDFFYSVNILIQIYVNLKFKNLNIYSLKNEFKYLLKIFFLNFLLNAFDRWNNWLYFVHSALNICLKKHIAFYFSPNMQNLRRNCDLDLFMFISSWLSIDLISKYRKLLWVLPTLIIST